MNQNKKRQKVITINDQKKTMNKNELNLVKRLPIGIIMLDASGVIIEANPKACALLGCYLVHQKWIEVAAKVFSPKQDDGHEISLKNGKRVSLDTTALSPSPGQMITVYDVTATRMLQSEIASRMQLIEMGKMAAKLAHQIRTPLSSMLLYLGNLQVDNLSEDKKNKFIKKIKSSIHDLEQQVNDMLLFSKGHHTVLRKIFIQDLFEDIDEKMSSIVDANEMNLVIRDESENLAFNANLEALSAALQNLIHNAIQASEKNTTIKLLALIHNNFLELSVEDHGCGIQDSEIKNVTKAFYTTKSKGTGLGLAVVQAVIKAHYGEIKVESEVNKGTSIKLIIPIQ